MRKSGSIEESFENVVAAVKELYVNNPISNTEAAEAARNLINFYTTLRDIKLRLLHERRGS